MEKLQRATFGAGCFWGIEEDYRRTKGVKNTLVGYEGGHFENPTYENVCGGKTGHAEVVQMEYDPSEVSYEELLRVFWKIHDPTTLHRQGPDVGAQYRSIIFFHTPEEETAAKKSKDEWQKKIDSGMKPTLWEGKKIVTEIVPTSTFWRAEEYHQQYIAKGGVATCHI